VKYILFVLLIASASCTMNVKEKQPEYTPVNLPKEEAPKASGYACPMKCEGDKVYTDSTRQCPVCEMDLVQVQAENNEKK